MDVFIFSSINLTNIWTGIGAQLWAVSQRSPRAMKELATKSERMKVGSFGLFYCSQVQCLKTPFIVAGKPEPDIVITDIWTEEWVMPFRIIPLGTPKKRIMKSWMINNLEIFREKNTRNLSHALVIQPTAVFAPTIFPENDWSEIFSRLIK